MYELKPCPFCGGEAVGVEEEGVIVWASCAFCAANGPVCYTEEEAIEAWNHRA